MHKINKVASLSIAVIIIILCIVPAYAIDNDFALSSEEIQTLTYGLHDIEATKEVWNMENVNFQNLQIGSPIQTYEVTDTELIESSTLYPIIYENKLVLWAMPMENQFQFTIGLVNEINEIVAVNDEFSIIYDRNSAFFV